MCDAGRSAAVKSPEKERGSETWCWCLFLIEQALMLDVDYGSYPVSFRCFGLFSCTNTHKQPQFVTSSSTSLAGIIGGLTLNPKNITETVGVVKACMLIASRP
jgi:adenylosuccinate synthase